MLYPQPLVDIAKHLHKHFKVMHFKVENNPHLRVINPLLSTLYWRLRNKRFASSKPNSWTKSYRLLIEHYCYFFTWHSQSCKSHQEEQSNICFRQYGSVNSFLNKLLWMYVSLQVKGVQLTHRSSLYTSSLGSRGHCSFPWNPLMQCISIIQGGQ